MGNNFFDESKEQSRIKTTIVAKYFHAWARVIMGAQDRHERYGEHKIAYIDLFAGPGKYADGTKATPVLILEDAISHPDISKRLVTIFNDKDPVNTSSLQDVISRIPRIDTLMYEPQINTGEVGEEIVQLFERVRLVPTLFFVDPWGYKGLSLRLLNSVVKDWGCDCIFFFNYNRINPGLRNPSVQTHMEALFGPERSNALRSQLHAALPANRELLILEAICQALKSDGPRYVLPFRFRDDRGTRTSHHLIFVSKDFKGYEIMKGIMAKECSRAEQGVPSFEYNPVDLQNANQQRFLFQMSRPLDELSETLLREFAGQTLTMDKIYKQHNVDTPYIKKNYKDALSRLEQEGKIAASKHRKGSFPDDVQATFPPNKGDENSVR